MKPWTLPFALLGLVLTSGCSKTTSDGPPLVPAPTRSIRLVEELRTGDDESPGAPLFAGPGAIDVDESGTMYVADWRYRRIYVVDSDGRLVRSIGSPGEGPGEFGQSPIDVVVEGDSVIVLEWGGKLTVFDRQSGEYRREYDLPGVERHNINGILVRRGQELVVMAQGRHPPGGDGQNLLLGVSAGNKSVDILYSMPTTDESLKGDNGSITSVPFTRGPLCTTTQGQLFCGNTGFMRFTELSLEGDSLRQFALEFDPAPITASERFGFEDEYAGTEFEASLHVPATWPAYYSVTGDDRSRLWIAVRTGRADTTTTFWIVDTARMESATASVPGRLRPGVIVGDKLYGVHTDASGVTSVVRYSIVE